MPKKLSTEIHSTNSSQSKLLIRLDYDVPVLDTDCDPSQSCATAVINSLKMDAIRYYNIVTTMLQWLEVVGDVRYA